jgi:predicted hotdog family 3-hydroxylacyl-ACP dehydratase
MLYFSVVFDVADFQDIVPHELRIILINHLQTVEDERMLTRGNGAASQQRDLYF